MVMQLAASLLFGIFRFALALVVLACVAASCFYAYEFGWTRGATDETKLALALTAAALDLLKTGLPLLASRTAEIGQKIGAWIGFLVLTCLSLWCAYGMNATQLAERMANKEVAVAKKAEADGVVARLRADRAALPAFTPTTAGAVTVADTALATAKDQRAAECAKRGPLCRDREADERNALAALSKAQSDKAITDKANDFDARIAAAEEAASKVDIRTAMTKADPQSEDMAKLMGVSADFIALLSGALFALGIEVGSGLGFWLVFHSKEAPPARRPRIYSEPASEAQQVVLAPLIDTPNQVRARFFDECLVPAPEHRTPGADLYVAYAKWCADNNFDPMTSHNFGRDPPWEKKRIGGNVVYVGCRLIEAYAISRPALRVVASN